MALMLMALSAIVSLHVFMVSLEHLKSTRRLLQAFTDRTEKEKRRENWTVEDAIVFQNTPGLRDFVPDHLAFDCEEGVYGTVLSGEEEVYRQVR